MTKKEKWLPVPNYEGLYEVSNIGRIKSLKRFGRRSTNILKGSDVGGYILVALSKGTKESRQGLMVHRLVAAAFIGKRRKGMEINHKNGKKKDNRVENLEWVTRKENVRHGFRTGLIKPNPCHHFKTRVVQLTLDEKYIKFWDSQTDAKRETGAKNISYVCLGLRNHSGGFKWKYA